MITYLEDFKGLAKSSLGEITQPRARLIDPPSILDISTRESGVEPVSLDLFCSSPAAQFMCNDTPTDVRREGLDI